MLIGQDDNGQTVEAHHGDWIVIRLAENPTTGYLWELGEVQGEIIVFKGSDYTPDIPILTGSGGVRTFSFLAQSSGTVNVHLELKRSWEDTSIETFDVTIRVQA